MVVTLSFYSSLYHVHKSIFPLFLLENKGFLYLVELKTRDFTPRRLVSALFRGDWIIYDAAGLQPINLKRILWFSVVCVCVL